MEKIAAFLTLFLLVFIVVCGAESAERYKTVTYFEKTGQPITVAWDEVTNATGYVWRIKSIERQKYIIIDGATEHHTTDNSFTFNVPFLGHFVVEVKAVDDGGNASDWAKSDQDQYGIVAGERQGWWVYGHLSPAGQIEITTGE